MEAIPYFQSPLQRYSWYLSFFELTVHRADMHLNQWQAIIFMEKVKKLEAMELFPYLCLSFGEKAA